MPDPPTTVSSPRPYRNPFSKPREKYKFHAVRVGRMPGVYFTWQDAFAQVENFNNAQYGSFDFYEAALEYLHAKAKKPRTPSTSINASSKTPQVPTTASASSAANSARSASRAAPASSRGNLWGPSADNDIIDMSFDSDGESIQDVTGEIIHDLTFISDGDSDGDGPVRVKERKSANPRAAQLNRTDTLWQRRSPEPTTGPSSPYHPTSSSFGAASSSRPLSYPPSPGPSDPPTPSFQHASSPSGPSPYGAARSLHQPPLSHDDTLAQGAQQRVIYNPFVFKKSKTPTVNRVGSHGPPSSRGCPFDEPPSTSRFCVNPFASYKHEPYRPPPLLDEEVDYPSSPPRLPLDPDQSRSPSVEAEEENLDPPLSEQQQEILKRCMAGENIFFTGSAGTGKSVLLRALIRSLRSRSEGGGVGVTASTGMAALNIGGCTLHSWAGIGLGTGTAKKLCTFMNSPARKRWRESTTLLVDEISMLDGELLDKLDQIGRFMRLNDEAPFGGLQVIFCGDFLQLPPVSKDKKASFAFESKVWDKLFPLDNMVTLKNVFRQSDSRFVDCLESMRRGVVTEEHDNLLKSLDRPLDTSDGIRPVALYSRRIDVDRENMKSLGAIQSPIEQYDAIDRAHELLGGRRLTQAQATQMMNDRSRWLENLPLKVGAQVMLVTNWMKGLVNGSTGTVTAFMTPEDARNAGVTVPDEFYDDDPQDGGSSPRKSHMYRKKRRDLPERLWPVVHFPPHRNSPRGCPDTILVPQMTCTMENPDNEVEASRLQVPLILAWAITIHKSQGLTLDKVRVDLEGAFDCGQAYVAISRATGLQGLELRRYTRAKIMTSDTVLQWSQEMEWDELASHAALDY